LDENAEGGSPITANRKPITENRSWKGEDRRKKVKAEAEVEGRKTKTEKDRLEITILLC